MPLPVPPTAAAAAAFDICAHSVSTRSPAQIEGALQELSAKIERSAGAVAGKVSEGEAAVHRQAKADHAKTCQVRAESAPAASELNSCC